MPVQRIGKYPITGEIGSGGFGKVYSAQDPTVGRIVAIKVMNAPGDTELARRFRSEAMTVAMLAHKNIVTVHEYGEHEGAPYLVMEYLEGVNLQDLIKQGTLSLLEKVEIMTEVAEGLSAAHRLGVTHRDIKPANIMRLQDGSVKIMDFGIARIASESASRLTQTGFIVGTWSYMAPEQFNGVSDSLTDIFAFGVTFYELLTGRNPFSAPDPAGVFARITSVEPPPITTAIPACPEDLDRLVHKSLAKDREQRYANLQDLIVDAQPVLLDLRRAEAVNVFAKAGQHMAGGQLDQAQAAVRKTLQLDPTHSGARQLRNQIEKEMQRRDSAAKAGTLIDKAEKELREHLYDDAQATLAHARQYVSGDSPLQTRLMRADAVIENARRVAKLLDSARANLRRQDYTEAFKSATEALTADPDNSTGQALMQEIDAAIKQREARRRMQEELTRAEGLLLTGETEQALSLLQELERGNPGAAEIVTLRQRAESQWAEESRRLRLSNGVSECKALVRNQQFEEAGRKVDQLLADFPDAAELQNLRRHVTDRIAAKKRSEQLARLKTEAAAYVSRHEYDFAINLLQTGLAKLGEDGELTRLLQNAIASKETHERDQARARAVDEAQRLRRQRKYDDALGAIERAIQAWGDASELQKLMREIADERRQQAVGEITRRAQAALEQKNADSAAAGLREAIKRLGEHPDLRRLLNAAEAQIRERDRAQRVEAVLGAARQLVAARRLSDAVASLDSALRQFPNDASIVAEKQKIVAALEVEKREAEQREAEKIRREQEAQERLRLQQEEALRQQEAARRQQEEARRKEEALEKVRREEQARLAREQAEREAQREKERLQREQEEARRKNEVAQAVREVQSARDPEAATVILNAAFLKHGKIDPLLQEQQRIAGNLAERQRQEAIEKACGEAKSYARENRFDDAIRALNAAESRYPGALPLAAARAEIEQAQRQEEQARLAREQAQREAQREKERLQREQEEARRKKEIEQAVREAQAARDPEAATVILNAAFLKHGKVDPLLQEQQRIAENVAEKQRQEAIDKASSDARACSRRNQFDDAIRVLDAAEIRYPGALPFVAARAEVEQARAVFRRKSDLETGLAKISDYVQLGKLQAGCHLAEDLLKSHPESRELTDAAERLRKRIEEEEQTAELNNVTGQIEQSIGAQDWSRAVNQATGAFAKFPAAEGLARLKRQAEEGKQRKEIEDAEEGVKKARNAKNLELAAELAAAARIRWANEKRFVRIEEEIQEARAEQDVAAARKQADSGRFDEAERSVQQALKRRPNLPSAIDLLADIAARREAKRQMAQLAAENKAMAATASAGSRRNWLIIAGAAGLLIGGGIVWKLFFSPHPQKPETPNVVAERPNQPPSSQPSGQPFVQPSAEATAGSILVSSALANPQAVRGQDYADTLRASAGGPLTWSIANGALPSGLKLDAKTGRIHGRASALKGTYAFDAVATDGSGAKGHASLKIEVVEGTAAAATPAAGSGKTQPESGTASGAPQPSTSQPQPAAQPPAQAPCKDFSLRTFGDLKKGQFTWTGRLVNGQATINAEQVRGDYPSPGAPVRFTVVDKPDIAVGGPDHSNCWNAPLVIKGPSDSTVTVSVKWDIYQPPQ
jgi:serine/threonine-protein kinase